MVHTSTSMVFHFLWGKNEHSIVSMAWNTSNQKSHSINESGYRVAGRWDAKHTSSFANTFCTQTMPFPLITNLRAITRNDLPGNNNSTSCEHTCSSNHLLLKWSNTMFLSLLKRRTMPHIPLGVHTSWLRESTKLLLKKCQSWYEKA